jgi:Peptidase family M23
VSALSLDILPPCVYVERAATGQSLSFDLRFTNVGAEPYRLTAIEVEVFDGTGTRIMRRLFNEQYGLRPPIETIPDRIVPAGGTLRVFNPLHTFPAELELATVRCTCEVAEHLPAPEAERLEEWSELLEYAQEGGHIAASRGEAKILVAEVSPSEYQQKTELYLPLTGRVLVAEGHDFLSPHRRIDPEHPLAAGMGMRANSGRYADDYSIADGNGEPSGFGAPVRAPGAGIVLAAERNVPDNTPGADGVEMPPPPPDPMAAIFGNYVMIEHGNDEVSILGHLQHGSVEVGPGDAVETKQPIARLGLSGNTDFLHVHYQVQDGPDPRLAEGLPVRFEGVGPLVAGTIVESI